MVWSLLQPLYWLKQSPRECNRKNDHYLHNLGFTLLQTDLCVYIWFSQYGLFIISLYVNELILTCSTDDQMKAHKIELHE